MDYVGQCSELQSKEMASNTTGEWLEADFFSRKATPEETTDQVIIAGQPVVQIKI